MQLAVEGKIVFFSYKLTVVVLNFTKMAWSEKKVDARVCRKTMQPVGPCLKPIHRLDIVETNIALALRIDGD